MFEKPSHKILLRILSALVLLFMATLLLYRPIISYGITKFFKSQYSLQMKFELKSLTFSKLEVDNINVDNGAFTTSKIKIHFEYNDEQLFFHDFIIKDVSFDVQKMQELAKNFKTQKSGKEKDNRPEAEDFEFESDAIKRNFPIGNAEISVGTIISHGQVLPLKFLLMVENNEKVLWNIDIPKSQYKNETFEIAVNRISLSGFSLLKEKLPLFVNERFELDISSFKNKDHHLKNVTISLDKFKIESPEKDQQIGKISGQIKGSYNDFEIFNLSLLTDLKKDQTSIQLNDISSTYKDSFLPSFNLSIQKSKDKTSFDLKQKNQGFYASGHINENKDVYTITKSFINLKKISPYLKLFTKEENLPNELSGQVNATGKFNKSLLGKIQLKVKNLSGQYQKMVFNNGEILLNILDLNKFELEPNNFIKLDSFETTEKIDHINLSFTHNKSKITLNKGSFNYKGGAIKITKTYFDYDKKEFPLTTVNINDFPLEELLKIGLNEKDIKATGKLDGALFLAQNDKKLVLNDSTMNNQSNGVIRYKSGGASALGSSSNPSVKLLFDYLTDLNYNKIQVLMNADKNYDLKMKMSITGKNPQVLNGRPLKFNLNLDLNWMKLLTSTLGISRISERLEKKLFRKGP